MTPRCYLCGKPFYGQRRLVRTVSGPAHIACIGRRCSVCGVAMSIKGVARIRDGQIKCKTCDPYEMSQGTRPRRDSSRASTLKAIHLTRELLASQASLLEPADYDALEERPKTWGECRETTGPCAWVACRYHLALDVNPLNGSIKLNYPHMEPEEIEHPCALRLAAGGPLTLEDTGKHLNLTRERLRQVETRALLMLRRAAVELTDGE